MLDKFIPDMYFKNIFEVNYKKLKKNGVKCLLFDLDNTISPAKEVLLSSEIKKLFDGIKKDFKIILFSNNFPKRIRKFGDYYDIDIACISVKPLPYKYKLIFKKYGYEKKEIATIGDQLLTDIMGGNRVGITTILVDPVSKEDGKSTFLNRKMEKKIFKLLEEKKVLKKGKYYE